VCGEVPDVETAPSYAVAPRPLFRSESEDEFKRRVDIPQLAPGQTPYGRGKSLHGDRSGLLHEHSATLPKKLDSRAKGA